jgi:hypothetical protein
MRRRCCQSSVGVTAAVILINTSPNPAPRDPLTWDACLISELSVSPTVAAEGCNDIQVVTCHVADLSASLTPSLAQPSVEVEAWGPIRFATTL